MGRRVAARGSFMVHESPLSPGSDIRAGTGERPSLVGSRRSRIRMLVESGHSALEQQPRKSTSE